MKIFGVRTMDDAVDHAIWFDIIDWVPPQPPNITRLWSEALQNYHKKYLLGLGTAEKRARGCQW